jgi:hypothetical protein
MTYTQAVESICLFSAPHGPVGNSQAEKTVRLFRSVCRKTTFHWLQASLIASFDRSVFPRPKNASCPKSEERSFCSDPIACSPIT